MILHDSLVIVPYALFRWASGPEAIIGLGIMLAWFVHIIVAAWTGLGDAVGGLIVLLFPPRSGRSSVTRSNRGPRRAGRVR